MFHVSFLFVCRGNGGFLIQRTDSPADFLLLQVVTDVVLNLFEWRQLQRAFVVDIENAEYAVADNRCGCNL